MGLGCLDCGPWSLVLGLGDVVLVGVMVAKAFWV